MKDINENRITAQCPHVVQLSESLPLFRQCDVYGGGCVSSSCFSHAQPRPLSALQATAGVDGAEASAESPAAQGSLHHAIVLSSCEA